MDNENRNNNSKINNSLTQKEYEMKNFNTANAGTNPENIQPSNGDKNAVTKLTETTIATKDLSPKEAELAVNMNELTNLELVINDLQAKISSSNNKLTPIAKAKLRNDINEKKEEKKTLKTHISKLSKELMKEYRINAQGITRKSLRISARREKFHKRYGDNIRTSITKMITAFESDDITALQVELSKLDTKEGDALIMKALLKAPRFLHTKVVANADHRILYLQHFRTELGVKKEERPRRGRRSK